VAGTEHNHVGHDERDGGGTVGAQEVEEVRQVRGAGGNGVRNTCSSTNGEVRGKSYNGVQREEVATAAGRRERDKTERCSGVGTEETMSKRRAVHYTCASEDEEREGLTSRERGVVSQVPLKPGGPLRLSTLLVSSNV